MARLDDFLTEEERRAAAGLGDPGAEYDRLMGRVPQSVLAEEARRNAEDATEQALFDEEAEEMQTPRTVYREQARNIADEDFGAHLYQTAMNVPRPSAPANPYGEARTDPAPYGRGITAEGRANTRRAVSGVASGEDTQALLAGGWPGAMQEEETEQPAPDMTFTEAEAYPAADMVFTEAEAYPDDAQPAATVTWESLAGLPPVDDMTFTEAETGLFDEDNDEEPLVVERSAEMAAEDVPAWGREAEPTEEESPAWSGEEPPQYTNTSENRARLLALFTGLPGLIGGHANPERAGEIIDRGRARDEQDYARERTAYGERQAREQRGAQQRRDDSREAERRALEERRVVAQERGVGIREQTEARQTTSAELRDEARRLQNAQRARQNATAEEMADPDSAVSIAYQDSLRAARERMPAEMRERLNDEALGTLSAETIEGDNALNTYLRTSAARTRPEQRSRDAGSVAAGGGVGAQARTAQDRERWVAAYAPELVRRSRGAMTEEQALERAGVLYDASDDVGRRGMLNTTQSQAGTEARMSDTRGAGQQESLGRAMDEIAVLRTPVSRAERALQRAGAGGMRNVQLAMRSGVGPGALTDAEQELFQAVAEVRNLDLHAISGAAVTENELQRYQEAMGSTFFDWNGSMFGNWLRARRAALREAEAGARARYAPEVARRYDSRRDEETARGDGEDAAPAVPQSGTVMVRRRDRQGDPWRALPRSQYDRLTPEDRARLETR